ncbi:MAG: alpha-galactosidase, partial [Clostridia bacterium]|nr:alpha-galactosidase [Clostridia bacterium]
IQTHQSYIGYRILNGMQEKDVLKPMPAESLVYTGHYIDHELVANLEADCDARMKRKADGKPKRFLLTIGGAGAQRELFEAIIKHLLPLIKEKKAALYVNVGDYKKVWQTLCKRIKGLKDISTEHFKKQPRPILLNGWEACYFNISESTLLDLASIGKEIGIEMLVMDDGWFGERNDDEHSLGDWDANPKKLPHGLKGLGDKLAAKGMKFGIWVEPEMFNRHSKLYEQHPEWSIAIPGAHQSEGRKQRILDLANPEVVRYITDKMTEVFSSAKIDYVKWDMNRIFSDVYSQYLPAGRQGETAHRYICGLYKMMDELTRRFPDILFEGCASGGNRFDLGILSYFPQIWASDNTDALSRAYIQEGYSYGYPQSTYTAHVAASPNHQTLRVTTPETRFGVASFGVLGYECDVRDLSGDMKKKLAAQIELYKKLREVLQFGQFYRIRSGNVHEWVCVSPDKTQAVGMMLQELVQPNTQAERFFARGLDPQKTYHFYNVSQRVDVKQFGSLVNTLSPIHIKQDSMMHNIVAKAVKLKGEAEDVTATGEVLMSTGEALKPAFSGTGFNENVRVFPDFSLRLYFMESKANAE